MSAVALNVDLGELADEPAELYGIATIVNIACGGHAGDDESMDRAVALAVMAGARIAAHPSYPDRSDFGRKSLAMSLVDLKESVRSQCGALLRAARRNGGDVALLKAHGALYHDVGRDPEIAQATLDGALQGLERIRVEVVAAPGSALLELAATRGLSMSREGFADRAYREDGQLVPRGEPGALITDPERCAEQALRLARSGHYETLCLHADTPGALENARAVRRALEAEGLLKRCGSGARRDPPPKGRAP